MELGGGRSVDRLWNGCCWLVGFVLGVYAVGLEEFLCLKNFGGVEVRGDIFGA